MAFFARPNLDNTQFKQLEGSTLTLSGQTQIATTSGLTLYGGMSGGTPTYVPIIATNGDNFDVLTYCDGSITLQPSSASGATGIYTCASPTTCTVGGLDCCTLIYGVPVNEILEQILVPTLYPVPIVLPSISSFVLYCAGTSCVMSSLYEVGDIVCIDSCTHYCAGSMVDVYSGNSVCSGGPPIDYVFSNMFGIPDVTYSCSNITLCQPIGDPLAYTAHTIGYPSNPVSIYVKYSSGATIYDSSGVYYTGVTSGCTNVSEKTIAGVYPWYWGTDAVVPDISTSGCTQCLIDSYTCKCVGSSVNNICVDDFNVTAEYLWFAIPTGNTKACWQGANNVSNNGLIPGGLFPAPASWIIDSTESCWLSQGYEIYVSSYATDINYGMTFCN